MALTAKQKAAGVAAAQALIAKKKATLAKLEKQTASTNVPQGTKFVPTVTIGGAPGGYIPDVPQSTATFGGAPAAYKTPTEMGMSVLPQEQDKPKKIEEVSKEDKDAFALLEEAFKLYDLESLVPAIRQYMKDNLGPQQAKLKLKTEKVYQDRFKGNELRRAKGLNVLGEDAYLELENDYSETLRSYGLSDYFGVAKDANSRLARQQKMADVIGSDISAVEFKDRIKTVVTRVNMADTNTKTALRSLYAITDTDLVKYFLNPEEGSDRLKEKVTAAEISGASMTQGLGMTSLGTAEELARLGIDRAEALSGYSKIAEYLPTSEKLSSIYKEEGITYNKTTGEEEQFKGLASAKRKRERLVQSEISSFSGGPGTSQFSLKNKTSAGQI